MTARRPARLPHFAYVGRHRYFVTCCSLDRHGAFIDPALIALIREQFLTTCRDRRFEEIATIFMPDHAHMLVEGETDAAAFVPFMTLARQRMALTYRRAARRHLWQDGYYERVLRRDEDSVAVVRYMLDNPVRAGLAQVRSEYPFSWSTYGFDE